MYMLICICISLSAATAISFPRLAESKGWCSEGGPWPVVCVTVSNMFHYHQDCFSNETMLMVSCFHE